MIITTANSRIVGPDGNGVSGRIEILPISEFEYSASIGDRRKVVRKPIIVHFSDGKIIKADGADASYFVLEPTYGEGLHHDKTGLFYLARFFVFDEDKLIAKWEEQWVLDGSKNTTELEITEIDRACDENSVAYVVQEGLSGMKGVIIRSSFVTRGIGRISTEHKVATFSVAQLFRGDGTESIFVDETRRRLVSKTSDFIFELDQAFASNLSRAQFKYVDETRNRIQPEIDLVPLQIAGVENQTSNLQEWQNVNHEVLACVDSEGNLSAENLSGTNTGDQTIHLTGDITGSGSGTITNIPTTLSNTGVAPGTYGNATNIPQVQVDSKGRLVHVTNVLGDFVRPNETIELTGAISGTGTVNSGIATTLATVPPAKGGTGITSYTTGDMLYADDSNSLAKRAIGTQGQVLTVNASGVPAWADVPSELEETVILAPASISRNTISPAGDCHGLIIKASESQSVNLVEIQDSSGTPIAYADAGGNVAGRQLVSMVDTGTAPFAVASSTVVPNLNADLLDGQEASSFMPGNATIPTTQGGTGITSFATGDLLYASAENTLAKRAIGVEGQVLTVDNLGVPVWKAPVPPTESVIIAASDETTPISTTGVKVTFRMPYAFTLLGVKASLTTASTSGDMVVMVKEGVNVVLSTGIHIAEEQRTSTTHGTQPVISNANLADDAEVTIDVTTTGIGATGLKVYLLGYRP